MFPADAVVEAHDRVGAKPATCEVQLGDETAAVRESRRAFAELGRALIGARDTGETLDGVIADGPRMGGVSATLSPRRPRLRARPRRIRWITSGGYSPFPPLHAANASVLRVERTETGAPDGGR